MYMCLSKLKEFHGNSHCKVELFEESCGRKFIRKTSTSFEYDLRLLRQCTKQRLFHRLHICTPQVYKCGKNSQGHFFFDMEFVDGQTLSEKLSDDEKQSCLKEATEATDWVYDTIRKMCGGGTQ